METGEALRPERVFGFPGPLFPVGFLGREPDRPAAGLFGVREAEQLGGSLPVPPGCGHAPQAEDRQAAVPADAVEFGHLHCFGEGGLRCREVAVAEADPAQVACQDRLELADLGIDRLGLFEMVPRGFQVASYQCQVAEVVMCERLVYPVPGTAG